MLLKLFFYTTVLLISIIGYLNYTSDHLSLTVGDNAPNFKLNDANGNSHSLSDYAGQYLVLYFYPKNDTPGCTKEACHFRDDIAQFEKMGVKVVGVSVDTSASNEGFSKKYHLPFTLLADTDGKVANSYHALTNLYVIKVAKRYTFLIDPAGKISKIYTNVNVSNHSQQIIEDLKSIIPNNQHAQ